MQPTRQAPQRLGAPDWPGRRTTSVIFSPKGGHSPAAASLLPSNPTPDHIATLVVTLSSTAPHPLIWWSVVGRLLEVWYRTQTGPHCYACGNPVLHGTSSTNLVERRWTSSRSLISFFSHGRQAWNEYSKWRQMNAPYNLWKSAGVISMNDTFIALIIEFAFFAAFAQWRLGLSVTSTITP